MPDGSLQKLYNAVSTKYDIGTYDEFAQKMQDPTRRQKFYNAVSSTFDLGDYNTFNSKLGYDSKEVQQRSQTPNLDNNASKSAVQPMNAFEQSISDYNKTQPQNQQNLSVDVGMKQRSNLPTFQTPLIANQPLYQPSEKPLTDNVPFQPAQTENFMQAKENAFQLQQKRAADQVKAVQNSTKLYFDNTSDFGNLKDVAEANKPKDFSLKNFSQQPDKYSLEELSKIPAVQKKQADLVNGIKEGKYSVYTDNAGNPKVQYNMDDWQNFVAGLHNDGKVSAELDKLDNMSKDDKIAYLNDQLKADNQYLPVRPDEMSSAYQGGNLAPTMGKAALGTAAGLATGAITKSPALGLYVGGLLAGAGTIPSMGRNAKYNSLINYYKQAKQEGVPDDQAFDMADKASDADKYNAWLQGAALTAAGMLTGGEAAQAKTFLGGVGNFIKAQPQAIGEVSGLSAIGTAFTDAYKNHLGYKIGDPLQDMANTAYDQVLPTLAINMAMGIGTGALAASKPIISQAKGYLAKNLSTEQFTNYVNTQVANDVLSGEQGKKIMADYEAYKNAWDNIPDGFDDETKNSLAGLVQKKQALQATQKEKVSAADDNFKSDVKKDYQSQIDAVDKEIAQIKDGADWKTVDTDNLTGQTIKQQNEQPNINALKGQDEGNSAGVQGGADELADLEKNKSTQDKDNSVVGEWRDNLKNDKSVFWHGSPSGDMRGSYYGLHIGSNLAATQALESRIGVKADGTEWDGTEEYGKTKLAGKKTLEKLEKERGYFLTTGYNSGKDIPENDYYPSERKEKAKYSGGSEVSETAKPNIIPVKIKGEMSNSPNMPHEDSKANGLMKGQLKKGTAKRGYYYKNIGEDEGSISAVVPNSSHIEKIEPPKADNSVVVHAGDKKITNIDDSKLQSRDSGEYGKGFYVSKTETNQPYYGKIYSYFKINPDAKILNENSFDAEDYKKYEVEKNGYNYEKVKSNPNDYGDFKELLKIKTFGDAVKYDRKGLNDYGRKNGFDIYEPNKDEVVILNKKSVSSIEKPTTDNDVVNEPENKEQQNNIQSPLNTNDNATQKGEITENNIAEHQNGNESGQTAETGNSNSDVGSGEGQKEITPFAKAVKEKRDAQIGIVQDLLNKAGKLQDAFGVKDAQELINKFDHESEWNWNRQIKKTGIQELDTFIKDKNTSPESKAALKEVKSYLQNQKKAWGVKLSDFEPTQEKVTPVQESNTFTETGTEQKGEPTRQEQINDLLDRINTHNGKAKNYKGRAQEVNDLGLKYDDTRGKLFNKNGNVIKKRSTTTNQTATDFDVNSYADKTHQTIKQMIDDNGLISGVDVEGMDGKSMSIKQKEKALDDIKNGKNTNGAKAVYDAIERMQQQGYVDWKDNQTGQRQGIPFDEYFEKPAKELTDEELIDLNSQLGEDAFNNNFDEHFQDEENNEEPATTAESTQQPATGETTESAQGDGRSSETPESVPNAGGEPDTGGRAAGSTLPDAEARIKTAQAAHDKAKKDLEKAETRFAKEQGKQNDMFAGGQQKGMFAADRDEIKAALDPLRQKVKETKAALEQAIKDRDNLADKENPDLFDEEGEDAVRMKSSQKEKSKPSDTVNDTTSDTENATGVFAENTPRKETTDTNQKPIDLPELVQLAKDIAGGKYPRVKELADKLGYFSSKLKEIVLNKDLFKKENYEDLLKTLAHEIGHFVDFLPDETMKRGNILGRIASLKDFMEKYLPFKPGAEGMLTDAEKARIKQDTENALKQPKVIDEEIERRIGLTPQDVLDVWNSVDAGRNNPELLNFIQTLSDADKKSIVKEAMKGMVSSKLNHLVKIIKEKTGNKITVWDNPDAATLKAEVEKAIQDEVKKRKLWNDKEVYDEAYKLSKEWRPYDEATAGRKEKEYRKSSKEIYADMISVLFNSPGTLEEKAPKFFQAFMNYLDQKPEFKAVYEDTMNMLKNPDQVQEKRSENVQSGFEAAREKRRQIVAQQKAINSAKSLWHEFKRQFVSIAYPLYDKLPNTKTPNGLSAKENVRNRVEQMFMWKAKTALLMDDYKTKVSDPLVENGINVDDVGELLQYIRNMSPAREDKANPFGFQLEEHNLAGAKKILDKYTPEQQDVIDKTLKDFFEMNFNVMQDAKDAGLITEDMWQEIQKNKYNYATFKPVKYIDERIQTAKLLNIKGGLSEIANPFVETMTKMAMIQRAAERNKTVLAAKDALQKFSPDTIKETEYDYRGHPKEPLSYGKDYVFYKKNGKPAIFMTDKDIAKIFATEEPEKINLGIQLLNNLSAPLKAAWTRYNPGFTFYSNLIKDGQRSLNNIVSILSANDKMKGADMVLGAEYAKEYPQALKDANSVMSQNPTETAKRMLAFGAINPESAIFSNYNPEYSAMGNIMSHYELTQHHLGLEKAKKSLYKKASDVVSYLPDKLIARPGQHLELANKITGFRILEKRLGTEAAAYYTRNFIGTPNFSEKTAANYSFIPFAKVIMQGMRNDIDLMGSKKSRGAYWLTKGLYTVLPAVLTGLAYRGYFDNDKDENGKKLSNTLQKLSKYQTGNYMNIPLGQTSDGKAAAIPIPMDDISRVVYQEIMNPFLKEDGVAHARDVWNPIKNSLPDMYSGYALYGNWYQFLAEGQNPYDNYYNRNIISDRNFQIGGKAALGDMMKYTYNQLGYKLPTKEFGETTSAKEKILSLPLLNRLYKESNAGDYEYLKNIKQVTNQKAAERLQNIDNAILGTLDGEARKALKEKNYTPETLFNLTKDAYQKYSGKTKIETPQDKQDVETIKSKVKLLMQKDMTKDITVANAVISAGSNAERQAILGEYKKRTTEEQYNKLLQALNNAGVKYPK